MTNDVDTSSGPVVTLRLNHTTAVPVYAKVQHQAQHPGDGPRIVVLSGGTAARALSQTLPTYTHNSSHILPVFDDGGSSRELRQRLFMPPPGDLRNRLLALSDLSVRGNPDVARLFQTRLPVDATPEALRAALEGFLAEDHPQLSQVERRYRRIIITHLERFASRMPPEFDLRGGNIGNFVIAGAYLATRDLESVLFEFSALAAVRGEVFPVCSAASLHLKAELADGSTLIGQSRISTEDHPPIVRLAIVERVGSEWIEVRPPINPLAERAIRRASLAVFSMGSFYTSLVSNLLVGNIGQVLRETPCARLFVANLRRDKETRNLTVAEMLAELHRYLRASDPRPGPIGHYVNYVLVGDHGDDDRDGRVPVDVDAIRKLGVEPIVLPLERRDMPGAHDADLVAAVLISLAQ